VAEIGDFSERFARDLLAGRRQFPMDTKKVLFDLHGSFRTLIEATKQDVNEGEQVLYIYRTNEQLRASPVGQIWPGGFVGPYRAAMFEVWRWAMQEKRVLVRLAFAEVPEAHQADFESVD